MADYRDISTLHNWDKHLYNVWFGMIKRCYDPKSKDWKWYGGKNITVFGPWLYDVNKFREWAYKSGYKIGLTIDRVDSNGSYDPYNCEWVTIQENLAHRNFKNIFGDKRRCTNCLRTKSKELFHKLNNRFHSVCKLCRSRLRANGVRNIKTLYADPN